MSSSASLLRRASREHRVDRRLPIRHVDRCVGAVLEQQLHDLLVVVRGRADQRRRAARQRRRAAAHIRGLEEELHVRIRVVLEQETHDVDALRLVRRVDRRVAAVDSLPLADRAEQRRLAEDVPLIDVGARLDEALREIPVRIHDRDLQRRHAVRVRQIDVRAVLQQHVDARDAVLARGVEQRREPAAVEALRPALGRDVPLVVASASNARRCSHRA